MTIHQLLAQNLSACKLKILVFGPSPSTSSTDVAVYALLKKRKEIQTRLRQLGHVADFPEDLLTFSGSMPCDNTLVQEFILIKDYDMVVLLVESPGSNVELGLISIKPEFARKSQCFIREEYAGGLAHSACKSVKDLGGDFYPFKYPDDVDLCNLLTSVERQVQKIQLAKLLS